MGGLFSCPHQCCWPPFAFHRLPLAPPAWEKKSDSRRETAKDCSGPLCCLLVSLSTNRKVLLPLAQGSFCGSLGAPCNSPCSLSRARPPSGGCSQPVPTASSSVFLLKLPPLLRKLCFPQGSHHSRKTCIYTVHSEQVYQPLLGTPYWGSHLRNCLQETRKEHPERPP